MVWQASRSTQRPSEKIRSVSSCLLYTSTGARYGLQTMCEGGGQANATIIERLG